MRSFVGFLKNTQGITTIEWVALCAVVLLAAMGISSFVLQGVDGLGGAVVENMEEAADDLD